MADINVLYGDLVAHVQELSAKFVDGYLPANPATLPSDYDLDVRAYCVLCHAAFEDFVEAVALTVASNAVDRWILARKINDVIPALLAWNGAKLKIDGDDTTPETKPFDYLRPLIEEAQSAFSRGVFNNHGVSILYLRDILIPVAIEIMQDVNVLNSLKKLAEGRGAYAHKGRVKTVYAPEDAKQYVEDVLKLCDDIKAKALIQMI